MSLFQNLKIRTKVMIAFGGVLLVSVLLGGIALNSLSDVNAKAADVRDNWLPSTEILGEYDSRRRSTACAAPT